MEDLIENSLANARRSFEQTLIICAAKKGLILNESYAPDFEIIQMGPDYNILLHKPTMTQICQWSSKPGHIYDNGTISIRYEITCCP